MYSHLYQAASGQQTRPAWQAVAREGALSLGLMLPIEAFEGDTPSMAGHVQAAQLAERLGFAALGFRDVPLRDPLSGGRLLLGVASGDRTSEFPAFGVNALQRGDLLRDQIPTLRRLWAESFPPLRSPWGEMAGVDLVPKPALGSIPLLVTGHSQSELGWIAGHADGWVMYPRSLPVQAEVVKQWRAALQREASGAFKPFLQSYYIDLLDRPDAQAQPIHLGHRLGRYALIAQLEQLREIGVNHVVFNLKYGRRPALEVAQELGELVLPRVQTAHEPHGL
jgi:luciferase-type oxidoreductase